MNEKHKFVNWVKDHKKQLLIAGISVTAVIGIIIGLKNKEAIKELWENLENSLSKTTEKLPESITIVKTDPQLIEEVIPVRLYTSPQETFGVSQHIEIYLVADIILLKKQPRQQR